MISVYNSMYTYYTYARKDKCTWNYVGEDVCE